MREFASLHNHSHFSFMDGISRPEEIVEAAAEMGLRSVALTDHGALHGLADFYLAGKERGVRTIFGIEAYAIDDIESWRIDRETYAHDKKRIKREDSVDEDSSMDLKRRALYRKGHIVLLARNQVGLSNLYRLTHKAHKHGMYVKPRIDKMMMAQHCVGLIATTACMGGIVAAKCWAHERGECEWKDLVGEVEELRDIFGDGLFLELQFNEHESQVVVNDYMVRLSAETGIPLTVATDSHYIDPDDWRTQEILYMLRGNKTFSTRGNDWDFRIKNLYLKSGDEMWEAWERWGQNVERRLVELAFENTLVIDSMIDDFEPDTTQRLPSLEVEEPFRELGEIAIARMQQLGLDRDERYPERFMHEMRLIKEKGFANYFLVMRDIIGRAKREMLVGPGRGSAAGSLVCYLAGITNLDPIKHNLLFERFINPGRVELPDIDTDFQDTDLVKEMLRSSFGSDNVASISTYGTFQIKGLLKDVGRVHDLDHREINRVNKKIESELRVLYRDQDKSTIVIKLEDIVRVSPTYNAFVNMHPEVGQTIEKLYGRVRHVGRHACGVVIGDDLPSEMPVFTRQGELQTSLTMGIVNKHVEQMGFVKFDLLSLSTLSVIDKTLKLMCAERGMTYGDAYSLIDPTTLDVDDTVVLKTVFWKGNFSGIFQFTNEGICKVAMGIRPDCFNDVAAIGALYRPGPLKSNMHKLYAEYKKDPKKRKYLHPLMEEILEETYGCLVYQEQMLEIGSKIGLLDITDTNRLRKLLLKKDKSKKDEFLEKEKMELLEKFTSGCKENGMSDRHAIELWEMLEAFGGYGFNAAHAKSYAMISMQTAYLRTYYPLEFFAALLTYGKADDLQSYVDDVKRQGFKILPVDVNRSGASHRIEDGAIRLAFDSVLGVGKSAVKKIMDKQPFDSFFDYLYKTGGAKTATLPLIRIGAFNEIESNVAYLEKMYELWLDRPELRKVKGHEQFEELCAQIDEPEPWPMQRLIEYENELLGFNLRGTPFKLFDRWDKIELLNREGLVTTYTRFTNGVHDLACIPCIVKSVKERAQRRGGMMAFIKFGDNTGAEFEAPCFATIWRHVAGKVKKGNIYLVTFNRKLDEPLNLVVGRPGFAHTGDSSEGYFVDIDKLEV